MEQTLPFEIKRCMPWTQDLQNPKCLNCMRFADHQWQAFGRGLNQEWVISNRPMDCTQQILVSEGGAK